MMMRPQPFSCAYFTIWSPGCTSGSRQTRFSFISGRITPSTCACRRSGRFLRCLLHGFLHTHGDDAFGQIHAASLELRHGDSLQIDDLDDVQRKPGVLLREAHGLVKRHAGGIGPVERDHNGIVEHCNPLLSPVEPDRTIQHGALPQTPHAAHGREPNDADGHIPGNRARASPRVAHIPAGRRNA